MDTKPKAGDLIEWDTKLWVVREYQRSLSTDLVSVGPATKSGKLDKRYDGQSLVWSDCTLIKLAHRWGRPGPTCAVCGGIKGGDAAEWCPGPTTPQEAHP